MKEHAACTDRISAELVRKQLRTAFIGHQAHYIPATTSTNTIAQELARDGAPEGTLVIADHQTQGRGRLSRRWLSSPGEDLLFSVILRPPLKPAQAFHATLVSSLAVAQGIKRETGLAALIKWPNDIYIREKKTSGILTELGVCAGQLSYLIVGIGINCNSDPALHSGIKDSATSLRREAGHGIDRVPLLAAVLELLEGFYMRLQQGGFQTLKVMWDDLSLIRGRKIILSCGQESHEGIAESVTDDGMLIARDRHGQRHRFIIGDVSLSLK